MGTVQTKDWREGYTVWMLFGLLAFALLAAMPTPALAFPFGGQITVYHVCYNETIFTRLSPPTAGDYVWTTSTKTYQYGPPAGTGQWLLGLTSIPYDCLWSVNPILVVPAIAIAMMGSSGPAAPAYSPPAAPTSPTYAPPKSLTTPTSGVSSGTGSSGSSGARPVRLPPGKTPPPPPAPSIGRVVISEVYYTVGANRGTDPQHEWVELYNGSSVSANLSGWKIEDASRIARTIPAGTTIAPNGFLILAATSTVRGIWNIPQSIPVISFGALLGDGLSNTGDAVKIKNVNNAVVDGISWGTDRSVFNPPLATLEAGHSFARSALLKDGASPSDWIDAASPTPGR